MTKFFIAILLACASSFMVSAETIARHGAIEVRVSQMNSGCVGNVEFHSNTPDSFRDNNRDLSLALAATRTALQFECPQSPDSLAIKGYVAGDLKMEASASASDGWLLKQSQLTANVGGELLEGFSMEDLGYPRHELLERGDGYVLAKVGRAGTGNLYTVAMIHEFERDEPMFVSDGRWAMPYRQRNNSGKIADRIQSSQAIREMVCPRNCYGKVQIYHYATNHRSPRRANSFQMAEEPILTSELHSFSKETFVPKLSFYDTNFTGILRTVNDFCVRDAVEFENASLQKIEQMCPGVDATGHPLAARGFSRSRLLAENDGMRLYLADGRTYNTGGKPVARFEKDVLVAERVLANSEQMIQDDYLAFLATAGEGVELPKRTNDTLNLYHYAVGFNHPLFGTPMRHNGEIMHTDFPVVSSHSAPWQDGVGVTSENQWALRSLTAYSKSVADILQDHAESEDRQDRQAAAASKKVSEAEQKSRVEAARQAAAKRYGYLRLGEDYFAPHASWYKRNAKDDLGKSSLQHYLNGDFQATPHHVNYADYRAMLLKFVELSDTECLGYLPPNSEIYSITTMSTTYDGYGNVVSAPKEVGSRTVMVHPLLADVYKRAFEVQEGDLGDRQAAGAGVYAIQDIFAGRASYGSSVARITEPWRSIEWFFETEACDSAAMQQLLRNFSRAGRGESSLAKARLNYRGQKTGSDPSRAKLLFEDFVSGYARVTYTYSDAPKGWRPSSVASLMEQAATDYGATQIHHLMGRTKTLISVEIDGAEGTSLKEMHVAFPGNPAENSHYLNDIAYKTNKINHDYSISPDISVQTRVVEHHGELRKNNPDVLLVECLYQDGRSYLFWFGAKPSSAGDAELRALHPEHPYIGMPGSVDRCPASYPRS